MRYNPVVSSVGIEVECRNVSKRNMSRLLRGVSCKVINDGSVRHYQPTVLGFPFIRVESDLVRRTLRTMDLYHSEQEMGCEIVSPIIDTSVKGWENYILRIMDAVGKLGEGVAAETSIHVHVNAHGLPVDVIKNLVRLWQSVEAGVFRLSASEMGVYRGSIHRDSHYCRPLVKKGPHVQKCADGLHRPCFDVDAIQRCDSLDDLEKALGRIDRNNTHYHISRYMALGLHPLFRLGSVEFRTFNFTLVPANIITYVNLSKSLLRNAMDKQVEDYPLNPYGTSNLTLADMVNWLRIEDDSTIYTLENLWAMGEFPAPLAGWRMTHMEGQRRGFEWGRIRNELKPAPIPEDEKIWRSDSLTNDAVEITGTVSINEIVKAFKTVRRL